MGENQKSNNYQYVPYDEPGYECIRCLNWHELSDPTYKCVDIENTYLCYDCMAQELLSGEAFVVPDWDETTEPKKLVIRFFYHHLNETHEYIILTPIW